MRRNISDLGSHARRASTDSSTIALNVGESRSRGALVGSLLLLAASFALLVLAPVLLGRFQSASQTMPAGGFLPIAAASGIALGGGAAMIAVVARLVRDIELRPYAGLAPVLAVFAGFVLWGLHAQLPLIGVPSEYAGVFALMASVAGGAVVARPGALSRAAGWALSFFAPVTLLMLVWMGSGKSSLGDAIGSLAPQLKMFLGLSAASAFAMVVLGEASRVFARSQRTLEVVAPKTSQSFPVARESAEPLFPAPSLRRAEPLAIPNTAAPLHPSAHSAVLPTPNYDYAQRDQGDVYVPDEPGPRVNVWELNDDELPLPKRFSWWKVLFVSLLLLGGTGAAVYYGMILPNRAKERAAAELMQQKRAQIEAEVQREAAAKRALESKADAARLEAMLAAPAAAAAPAEEQAAPEATAAPAQATAEAPAAVPLAKAPPTVQQLKPERAAKPERARARSEAPARAASPSESASDDPIYGL